MVQATRHCGIGRDELRSVLFRHSYVVWRVVVHGAEKNHSFPLCCVTCSTCLHCSSRAIKKEDDQRGRLPCHISYGDFLFGSTVITVRCSVSHTQWDASVHNDAIAGDCAMGECSEAWVLSAISAPELKCRAPSATH